MPLNYQRHAFPTVNALHAFTGCVAIATRRDNYNAPWSSPFCVAYPRYLLAFFASTPLRNETAMHAHCPLVPFYLSLSLALCLFSRLFNLTLLPLSKLLLSSLLPRPKLNALAVPTLFPSLLLFSDGFSSSPSPQAFEPHLASTYQLFLICYTAIPSPPSVLLPTGPHENTYFTGIHDGRRTSVRTCLLGCL